MPYSIDNPPQWAKNKSKSIQEVAIRVFNSTLSKGKSELEARIASQAAMRNAEEADKDKVKKAEHEALPMHLRLILDAADQIEDTDDKELVKKAVLGADSLPVGLDRNLIKAVFNTRNQLVLKFDTGETITTNALELKAESIDSVVYAGGGYPDIPGVRGIVFNTTDVPVNDEDGMLTWNPIERTLDLNCTDGVMLQIGQEQHVNVANFTGSTLANARVVSFAGTDIEHDLPKAQLMVANGSMRPATIIGVTTEEIPDFGTHGRVTSFGKVRGIDTTGATYGQTWNEGDFLFVHPTIPGGLSNIEPAPPNASIFVGIVLAKSLTEGSIFVKPDITSLIRYGSFSSTQTQSIATPATPKAITYNSTEISSGITVVDGSKLTVSRSGLYKLDFSVQINKPSSGDDSLWIWIRKNGIDVPNSATRLLIQGNNAYDVAAWNFIQNMNAGDYLQLMFAVNDIAIELVTIAATGFAPAAPSVLAHMTQVS